MTIKKLSVFLVGVVVLLTTSTLSFASAKEQVLYSFCVVQGCVDGQQPTGVIFDDSGHLFGAALMGGDYNYGAVFELTLDKGTWIEQVLHSFNVDGKDGYYPSSSLITDSSGNLYGTTQQGGTGGAGIVFELTRINGQWTENVLHNFDWDNNDGKLPSGGLLLDRAGNLYGTASRGGAYGLGATFALLHDHGKWTETLIHSFQGKDGSEPSSGLAFDTAGNLYGTTARGGAYGAGCAGYGCGTVFALTHQNGKWIEKVLYSFNPNGEGGLIPAATLRLDLSGSLYGTTYIGGSMSDCNGVGCGVVFELLPGKNGRWTEHVLHRFHGSDGHSPSGGLIFSKSGSLCGTTYPGGAHDYGVVFALTPTNGKWMEKVLHNFNLDGKDGAGPGGVIVDKHGNLYGTTNGGGVIGGGTVFEITP